MALKMFGISHEQTSVEEREKVSLSENETFSFLKQLQTIREISECIVVSTCNRTEVYFVCDDGLEAGSLINLLLTHKNVTDRDLLHSFYHQDGIDVAKHLFAVSSGLKSQVLGENQILRQVKDSYSLAVKATTTGPLLNKLFHQAFRVGKKVRTETNIGAGAVSISSAAVELANFMYDTLSDKKAMLIGAGETGEIAAKIMIERGISSLQIANRTKENAEKLAGALGAQVVDFDKIAQEFTQSDIVICAASSPEHIITKKMLVASQNGSARKTVVIDIAIPRNVEPEVADMANIFLYNMDDLKSVVDRNMDKRRHAAVQAEKIVCNFTGEYENTVQYS